MAGNQRPIDCRIYNLDPERCNSNGDDRRPACSFQPPPSAFDARINWCALLTHGPAAETPTDANGTVGFPFFY